MNKILITGGSGAVGSNLTIALAKNKNNLIYVIDNLSSSTKKNFFKKNNIKYFVFDIENKQKILSLFKKYNFDYIFHLAAFFANQNSVEHPYKDLKTNAQGTLNILEATKKYNKNIKNIIYTSSSCVYGNSIGLNENYFSNELDTPYAITKLIGEHYMKFYNKEYKIPTMILRLFNTFGPYEYPGKYRNVIPNFISNAKKNLPIIVHGDGHQTRDFNYVENLIYILKKIYKKKTNKTEVFNVGFGQEVKIIDLANKIIRYTNSSSKIYFVKKRSWDTILRRKCDNRKLNKFLKLKQSYSLDIGLRKTIKWFDEIN